MAAIYTAYVKVTGGRNGHAKSSDGALDIVLVSPKEASEGKPGVNPEQLFAAGYAACFESAMRGIARKAGKPLADASIDAAVALVARETGGFVLDVNLDVVVQGVSQEDAAAFAQTAHNLVCPYSNAVRGNIDVRLRVTAV